ncbi:cysteinyl-tRNA synthetase [Actinomadura rupiterrae]|nr:cysteinyl-tRNA synthetase [Actinomadura rupiterrae]
MLAHHYRSDWEWTADQLDAATARLERWRAAADAPAGPSAYPVLEAVRERLSDDLDAPGALAAVDAWADAALAGTGDDAKAPAQVRALTDTLLGIAL